MKDRKFELKLNYAHPPPNISKFSLADLHSIDDNIQLLLYFGFHV